MHSLGKSGSRKKANKSRKSQDDNMRIILQSNEFSDLNNDSRHYIKDEDVKPPLPPLPLCYHKQQNDLNSSNQHQIYEKTYGESNSSLIAKQQLNAAQSNKVSQQPIYASNEAALNLEHQNRLMYQRQLSKSVGDNLQQSKPKFNTLDGKNRLLRPCLSAGDLLGKTHEELILLLIQLKRNQSQLSDTIENLRLQMESEDRLTTIEPHKIAEHKLKYEQVKEKLIETQNQYESQFPLIDLIDNMVRFNSNSNLKSNLHSIYGNNLNTNMNSFSTNNVYTLTSSNNKHNSAIYSTSIDTSKATSTSYLNHLDNAESSNDLQKRVINDESDYAGGESEKNNLESTYTNRSSCSVGGTLNQINEITSERNQDQSISRTLEIPSHSKSNTFNKTTQSNKLSDHQTSNSQTTNTLSSVIVTSKQLQNKKSNLNLQPNQQHSSINQSFVKSKAVLAEEEMERMKKQQKDLEKELERVRSLLLNSQLNLPHDKNLNDDLSTTENHFQLELENIDKEINNLNAKKEKLIQNLKYKKDDKFKDDLYANFRSRDHLGDRFNNATFEDGATDLFTDDDAIFSTVNSIVDFERVLDDENGLSLCTDVDELTAHENEYVQSLKGKLRFFNLI